jgi:hypothetical protein
VEFAFSEYRNTGKPSVRTGNLNKNRTGYLLNIASPVGQRKSRMVHIEI